MFVYTHTTIAGRCCWAGLSFKNRRQCFVYRSCSVCLHFQNSFKYHTVIVQIEPNKPLTDTLSTAPVLYGAQDTKQILLKVNNRIQNFSICQGLAIRACLHHCKRKSILQFCLYMSRSGPDLPTFMWVLSGRSGEMMP